MMASLNKLVSILKSDEGLISVEYGVLLTGVTALALVVVAELTGASGSVSVKLKSLLDEVQTKLALPTT